MKDRGLFKMGGREGGRAGRGEGERATRGGEGERRRLCDNLNFVIFNDIFNDENKNRIRISFDIDVTTVASAIGCCTDRQESCRA